MNDSDTHFDLLVNRYDQKRSFLRQESHDINKNEEHSKNKTNIEIQENNIDEQSSIKNAESHDFNKKEGHSKDKNSIEIKEKATFTENAEDSVKRTLQFDSSHKCIKCKKRDKCLYSVQYKPLETL